MVAAVEREIDKIKLQYRKVADVPACVSTARRRRVRLAALLIEGGLIDCNVMGHL